MYILISVYSKNRNRYLLLEFSQKSAKIGTLRLIGGKREPAERSLVQTVRRELIEEVQQDVDRVLDIDTRRLVARCKGLKELSNSRGVYTEYDLTVFGVGLYVKRGEFNYSAVPPRHLFWVPIEDIEDRMKSHPDAFGLAIKQPNVLVHAATTNVLYSMQPRDVGRIREL